MRSLCPLIGVLLMAATAHATETLYNGIVLPEQWPPQVSALTRAPLASPSYLTAPPPVIPIDVGRQLFVDDFLVADTTLTRTHHQAQYHPASPVLAPDRRTDGVGATGGRVGAGLFSDGVWYDPTDRLFKAFYWGGSVVDEQGKPVPGSLGSYTCLATSRDGIHWEKPALDVVPGTNVVLVDEPGYRRNSSTVWLDLQDPDPARRWKMFRNAGHEESVENALRVRHRLRISVSPDGVHWTLAGESDPCGDRTTVFYNAFRQKWVFGLREGSPEVSRCRGYREHADPLAGARWLDEQGNHPPWLWIGADSLDADRADLELRKVPERPWDLIPSQLYNLDCIAYESVLLGCFSIWRGHPNFNRPKINEVCVGFSRDGFQWSRPDRRAFAGVSEDPAAWNYGNVQSAGGCCLIVGDQLHFYVTAANRTLGPRTSLDATYTGLATLRRDGFTSLDAGAKPGTLTTRPVTFKGRYLFVNAKCPQGELRVEVLDGNGKPIKPFTREKCRPVKLDRTKQMIEWQGGCDLARLSGKPVRLRFHLRQGALYAFWVSPSQAGASHGYVAAGGPGFTGPRDE